MIAFKVLWGFLIHDTSEHNQGRKGHSCCAMLYRYLKWNLSREGKVTNECRNVPGNDDSIKKTFLQGFINLGDTTTFLVMFPGPHKHCETTSKGQQSVGTLEFWYGICFISGYRKRIFQRKCSLWLDATIVTWWRQLVLAMHLPSLTSKNKFTDSD